MREISGWWMAKVFFLNEEPGKKEDIVCKISGIFTEVAGGDDYVYPTEQEAWVEAKKELRHGSKGPCFG